MYIYFILVLRYGRFSYTVCDLQATEVQLPGREQRETQYSVKKDLLYLNIAIILPAKGNEQSLNNSKNTVLTT